MAITAKPANACIPIRSDKNNAPSVMANGGNQQRNQHQVGSPRARQNRKVEQVSERR
jgi:hypothetical protein